MYTRVQFVFIPPTEALWQPARKSTANENRRPIYVFSTDLANSAADAVLKNCYDSIVQFHNAQPKGPGYLCLSKKQEPKKAVNSTSTRNLSGSDNEKEDNTRATKRRSSRLSASDETPATKKLRSGRQADDAKRTRFSRRLRRQQQSSASPPSSPASDHSSSDSQASPPASQRGRGRQRPSRGAARRRGGQRGRGRGRRQFGGRRGGEVEEEEEEEAEEDSDNEEEDEGEHEEERDDDGEMDESRETDKLEAEGDGEVSAQSPGDAYDDKQDTSPRDPSTNLPQQTPSEQQSMVDKDNNYTICHGTPRTKGGRSAAVDMSSPASQTRQLKSAAVSSPTGTAPPSESSHPTPHDTSSLSVADKQQKPAPSNVSGITSGSRSQDLMIGGQQPHSDMHKDAAAPNNWPGGLGHQFSHVPPGYYGAGIHPMHYASHATQHVPSANYSYGMYPWGAHHVGQPSRDPQHPYATHESAQHARSATAASSQAGHLSQSGGHASVPPAAYQRHPHTVHHSHPPVSTPSETGKEITSAGSQGRESAGTTPSHEKHPTQPHHAHSHASLHQLSGPGSAQVHHAFPRPPHTLTTEQLSAATAVHHHPAAAAAPFTYGFDPSNPAALSHMHHLWQQQQHQIRAAGVHPSHLPPHLQHTATAAGMWYSPHVQQLMQHGGALTDESAKRRALAAQSAGSKHPQVDASAALRMNSNRNNNNSNTEQSSLVTTVRGIHSPSPHSQTMLLYGNTNSDPSPQATEWTRRSTGDIQSLTGSIPR